MKATWYGHDRHGQDVVEPSRNEDLVREAAQAVADSTGEVVYVFPEPGAGYVEVHPGEADPLWRATMTALRAGQWTEAEDGFARLDRLAQRDQHPRNVDPRTCFALATLVLNECVGSSIARVLASRLSSLAIAQLWRTDVRDLPRGRSLRPARGEA